VLADGPAAYYRLADTGTTLADLSANGLAGTYSTTGVSLQRYVTAGDLGGLFTGGRATVPHAAPLLPSHVTVEAVVAWFGDTGGIVQRIVEKSVSGSGTAPIYSLQVNSNGRLSAEFRIANATVGVTSTSALPACQAVHVAGTYTGTEITVHINGVQQATAPASGTLEATTQPLGIGNQVERDRPFNGRIDEVAIYPTALSSAQILAHALLIPDLGTGDLCNNAPDPTDGGAGTGGTGGIDGGADGGGTAGTAGAAGTSGSSGTDAGAGTAGEAGLDGGSGTGGTSGTAGAGGTDPSDGSGGTPDGSGGTTDGSSDASAGTGGVTDASSDAAGGTGGATAGAAGAGGTGRDGGSGTGGSSGRAGSTGMGGTSGTPAAGTIAGEDGGCGCRVAESSRNGGVLFGLFGLAWLALGRRRRR
jgi:MYXO-CTERM domain-containing protein